MNSNRIARQIATLAALAIGIFTSAASASTLNLVSANESRGSWGTFSYNGSEHSGWVGALSFTVDGGVALYDFYCVDLMTQAYVNSPYEAVALPPTALSNGERAAWLYANYAPLADTVATGTALQLALWDVVHDGGNGLNTGVFQASAFSAEILNQATSYINASLGKSSSDAVIWESLAGREDRQLQIGGNVPEPSTVVMMMSGLVLVGWGVRRKKPTN